jgi:CrcB protein
MACLPFPRYKIKGTNRPASLQGLMMPAPPASGGAGVPAAAATGHFHSSGDALVGVTGFVAIGLGGAIGCWSRWLLGMALNPLFPTLPLGTLAANLAGGLLMGCVMGLFDHFQTLSPELRLFVFTGFLGGLTTFSTFSAESATLLLRQQYLWFSGHVAVHVVGSISMTVIGIALTRSLLRH